MTSEAELWRIATALETLTDALLSVAAIEALKFNRSLDVPPSTGRHINEADVQSFVRGLKR